MEKVVVLLFTPEMVLVIDSVKFQTDSVMTPSIVIGERVFLAVAVRIGREEEDELLEDGPAEVVKVCSVPLVVPALLAATAR